MALLIIDNVQLTDAPRAPPAARGEGTDGKIVLTSAKALTAAKALLNFS